MTTRIFRYFEAIMVLAYAVFGVFVIFFSNEIISLNKFQRIGFGIILIGYSFYRSYRVYKKYSIKEQHDEE